MYQKEVEDLISRLVENSKMEKEEVIKLIEGKKKELGGLVSDAGAAQIVANELGLQTLPLKTFFRVEDLKDGLSNVDLVLRIVRVFPIKEFESKGKKGQMASAIVGDETGTTRLVLWGKQAALVEQLKKDMIIKLVGGYAKLNNRGVPELHTGSRARVLPNPEDERCKELPAADSIAQTGAPGGTGGFATETVPVSELKEGMNVRIRACILKVVQRNPFYEVCPSCGKSLTEKACKEHGQVSPSKALVANAVVDDGSGNLRTVFFKGAAEELLGMSTQEAEKLAKLTGNPVVVLSAAEKAIGREKIFIGRVKKNEMFDRLEMVVNRVEEVNVEEEIKSLLKQL